MAIQEKVTQEDLILYEVLKNPILFAEFINNLDKLDYEEKYELTLYQKEFLGDFNQYVDICCARAVGKTESLANLIVWLLTLNVFPGDYILYTVPNKVHLEPVFTKLIRIFRANKFAQHFITVGGGINSGSYIITLLNHAQLHCRIAGTSGGGANVVGLHTPFEIVDEGGYYPWGTWIELQPTFNTWVNGSRLIVSGVPTGLRERNVLYYTDMENSDYTKHRISAYQNPRFSDEDKRKAIMQYGGEDSDDFIHLVLGQHGRPVYALFDRGQFDISNYPVYKLNINGNELSENIGEYLNKLSFLPGIPDQSCKVYMGVDLGYTEPTAIALMYMDKVGRLKFHARIKLEKVSYNIQDRFIDALDSKFKPALIGIDEGGVGKPVVQRLLEAAEFTHKSYNKRMIPINFAQAIAIGIDSAGEEIKNKAKPLAVSVLQEYCNNHKITFTSTDLEMITELERMTYTKTPSGEIIYKTITERGGKKGEDHFTAALLCLVLAYYLKNESLNFARGRGKLADARWFMGVPL